MKRIGVFLMMLLIFTGCSAQKKETILTIYSNDEWIPRGDMETAVQDERIDAVNKILKEKGKDYQVELHYLPVWYLDGPREEPVQFMMDCVKKAQAANADIMYFDHSTPVVSEFMSLDSYMETEKGQELRKEFPSHSFEANKVNGEIRYIPSLYDPYIQYGAYVEKSYYEEHKEGIEEHRKDPVELLNYLIDTYKKQENKVLYRRNIIIEFLMKEQYAPIQGTKLYVRRSDHKVINPFENEDFMKAYQVLIKGVLGDATYIEEDGSPEIKEEQLFAISLFPVEDSIYLDQREEDKRYFYFGEKMPNGNGGYGIMKTSQKKEEAFDFLYEMNTDPEITNLLQYGTDPELDQEGKVIVDESNAYASLGNNLISKVNCYQKDKKKEIMFKGDAKIDSEVTSASIVLDLAPVIDKLEGISDVSVGLNGYPSVYDTYEEYMEHIQASLAKMKEAGVDEVIAELQKQVDALYQ